MSVKERNFLKSSLQNAALNIILQVSFRCITFVLNAFVIRYVSQEVIGIMYVRLLLLESTVLFLSREAFRKACLTKTMNHNWPQVINLVWITVPICCILSLTLGYVWINLLSQPSPNVVFHYKVGVWAIGISCIIDMCCEPLYLITQAFLFVKLRAFVDIASVLVRSVTFAAVVWYDAEKAIIAFSVAQILSVVTYTGLYYVYFIYRIYADNNLSSHRDDSAELRKDTSETHSDFPLHSVKDIFPKKLKNQDQIDRNLSSLIWSFLKQGVMMQLLTEGERYIMTLLNVLTFAEQGIFDVVNNLGSLTARFVFRPIEESAYFYFSQLVHRGENIVKQDQTQMREAAFTLECLLRTVTTIGLLVVSFGQAYAKLALYLYGGDKLASGLGSKLLRTHCLSIFLIAINGTTESYAFATMDKDRLNRYNKVMMVLSTGFLIANWLLSYTFGSVGFILANCCNMIARIAHSVHFIREKYENSAYHPLKGLVPRIGFLCVLALSTVLTTASEAYFYESYTLVHFVIGAVLFLITTFYWAYDERELITYGMSAWRKKQQ